MIGPSITALVSIISLGSQQAKDQALLTFQVDSLENVIRFELPDGLHGEIERDELGWVISVFKGKSRDSLLYPQKRWHGAWPCHLYAWSHKKKTFPDVRVIPIRGSKLSLVVDLSRVASEGEPDHERFTGGSIAVGLRHGA